MLAVAVTIFVAVTIIVAGTGVFDGMDVGDCPGWLIFVGVAVKDGRIVTTGIVCAVTVGKGLEVGVKLAVTVGKLVDVAVGKLVNIVVSEAVGEKKRVANASMVSARSVLLVAVILSPPVFGMISLA